MAPPKIKLPPVKVPPAKLSAASQTALELAEKSAQGGDAVKVLLDMIHGGELPGSKVYGKNSLEVKKDLYKKVKEIPNALDASVATDYEVQAERDARHWQKTGSQRPHGFFTDEGDYIPRIEDPGFKDDLIRNRRGNLRSGEASIDGTDLRMSRAAAAQGNVATEGFMWSDLMDDPAFKFTAGAVGTGALLASGEASAQTNPHGFEDEAPASNPHGFEDEPVQASNPHGFADEPPQTDEQRIAGWIDTLQPSDFRQHSQDADLLEPLKRPGVLDVAKQVGGAIGDAVSQSRLARNARNFADIGVFGPVTVVGKDTEGRGPTAQEQRAAESPVLNVTANLMAATDAYSMGLGSRLAAVGDVVGKAGGEFVADVMENPWQASPLDSAKKIYMEALPKWHKLYIEADEMADPLLTTGAGLAGAFPNIASKAGQLAMMGAFGGTYGLLKADPTDSGAMREGFQQGALFGVAFGAALKGGAAGTAKVAELAKAGAGKIAAIASKRAVIMVGPDDMLQMARELGTLRPTVEPSVTPQQAKAFDEHLTFKSKSEVVEQVKSSKVSEKTKQEALAKVNETPQQKIERYESEDLDTGRAAVLSHEPIQTQAHDRMVRAVAGQEPIYAAKPTDKDFKPGLAFAQVDEKGRVMASMVEVSDRRVAMHVADVTDPREALAFAKQAGALMPGTKVMMEVSNEVGTMPSLHQRIFSKTFVPKPQQGKMLLALDGLTEGKTNPIQSQVLMKAREQVQYGPDKDPLTEFWDIPSVKDRGGQIVTFDRDQGIMHLTDYNSYKVRAMAAETLGVQRYIGPDGKEVFGLPWTEPKKNTRGIIPLDPQDKLPTFPQVMERSEQMALPTKAGPVQEIYAPPGYRPVETSEEEWVKIFEKYRKRSSNKPPPIKQAVTEAKPLPRPIPDPIQPPSVPPGPQTLPPSAAPALWAWQKLLRYPDALDKIFRPLLGAYNRAGQDFVQYVGSKKASEAWARSGEMVRSALDRARGRPLNTAERAQIDHAFRTGKIDEFFKARPDLAGTDYQKHVIELRREMDTMSQEINRLTGGAWDEAEALRGKGDGDPYFPRLHLRDFLPEGELARIYRSNDTRLKAVFERFKNGVLKESKAPMTDSEISVLFTEAIDANDLEQSWSKFAATVSANHPNSTGNLIKRKDIPQFYRDVIGEIKDGHLMAGRGFATQKSLLIRLKAFEAMAADSRITPPAGVPDETLASLIQQGKLVPLPDNKVKYGPLSGKLVNRDALPFIDGLGESEKAAGRVMQFIQNVARNVKKNLAVIGSTTTWTSSHYSNLFVHGPWSGGLSPITKPLQTGQDLKFAAKSMWDFRNKPYGDMGEHAGWYRKAMDYDVVGSGYYSIELKESQVQAANDVLRHLALDLPEKATVWDYWNAANAKWNRVTDKVGAFFEANDTVHRLAAWRRLVLNKTAEGMTEDAAMKWAAQMINNTFPSPGHVGPVAAALRKATPVINSFVGMAMEQTVRLPLVAHQVLQNDPQAKWRLLSGAATLASVYGSYGYARNQFGISNDEMEFAELIRSRSAQTHKWATVTVPFRVDGKVYLIDMTQTLGPLSYLHMDPEAGPIVNTLQSVSGFMFGNSMVDPIVQKGWELAGFPMNEVASPKTLPGEGGLLKFTEGLWGAGLAPTAPLRAYQSFQNNGQVGTPDWRQEISQVAPILRLLGINVQAVSTGKYSPTFIRSVIRQAKEIQDLQASLNYVYSLPDDKARGPLVDAWDKLLRMTNFRTTGQWKKEIGTAIIDEMKKRGQNLDQLSKMRQHLNLLEAGTTDEE